MAVPTRNNAVTATISTVLGLLTLMGSVNSESSLLSLPLSATSSAAAATHTVTVGVDGLTYNPTSLTANVGDTVLFIFYPQNHSVARAEYGYPCIPYENTGPNKVGFWSGFQPVSAPSENAPRFALQINDTEPTFFYCSADGACVPNGMIGVINPNETQSLKNQMAFVHNATTQLSPGQQNPPESTSTPAPTPSATGISNSSSSGISEGAIAGIVVGAVVVVALAGLTFYLCGRNKTLTSVLLYSQPPSRLRSQNIVPVPYSPSSTYTPCSPKFSPKQGQQPSPTSPEMTAASGTMSPQLFNQSYGHDGYGPVETPGNNIATYQGQQSPGSATWSQQGGYNQGQYAPVLNEMATGHGPLASPGQQSYEPPDHQSHQTQPVQEFHELDARSSVPETPGVLPPQYAP